MKKVLLLYNIQSPIYRKHIEAFCEDRDIQARYVLPEEYDTPLGFVAYGSPENCSEYIRQAAGKEFGDPLMVFSGFTQDDLFQTLKDLKTSGIATTDLKAVMTEHNAQWDSVALWEELSKEHEYMKKRAEEARKKMVK